MTGPLVPVGMLNLIRGVLGIHHHRFNLSVKRSSTIKIAHTTGADAETYEKRKAEQERSARRCLVFYRDRSTDNAGGGVLKILEPSRGWAHLIGSAPRQATELSPGAPV